MRPLRSVLTGLVIAALLALASSVHAQTSPPPRLTPDDLFDQNTVQDILLTVNSSDWTALREHYLENVYYVADLRWRGEVVRNVGIRSRGRGSRSESKPGLRVDFNRYTSGQQFLGLKSLVLDNLTQDPSMLKERVVMRFFTEMGMPAPRVVHARLFVNNAFAGLYTIVESIDKDFLKRTLDENDGYLYEFTHTDPYGFEYLGSELEKYAEFFEPKTHENDSMASLYLPIKELAWTVSESPDSQFVSSMGRIPGSADLLEVRRGGKLPRRSRRCARRLGDEQFLSLSLRRQDAVAVAPLGQGQQLLGGGLRHLEKHGGERACEAGAQGTGASACLSRDAAALRRAGASTSRARSRPRPAEIHRRDAGSGLARAGSELRLRPDPRRRPG